VEFWIVYFVTLKVYGEIISKLQAKSELGAAQPETLCLWGLAPEAVNNETKPSKATKISRLHNSEKYS
jgi:hypothetical protein